MPFVQGGARNIVEWLEETLRADGHDVERVYLPQVDDPAILVRQMVAYRWIDLSSADRVICFRPPSHLIQHPRKVVWFIHHVRTLYDLWDSEYRLFPDDLEHRGIRSAVHAADTAALKEAYAVFTNSQVVADRLLGFNGVRGEVLYPPIFQPERFRTNGFNGEIVSICRLVRHKRQHLLIEAMRFTRSNVTLRLCGASLDPGYVSELHALIRDARLDEKVHVEDRWISEDEKADILANCLASAYLPVDEDSYGYPTLEAAHSGKATVTTNDSGGVLEFVENDASGIVTSSDAKAIAEAMDALYERRELAERLGEGARARIVDLKINWNHVLKRLLA
jgi:glycosyltransferase involved in cell wall biosynthesis